MLRHRKPHSRLRFLPLRHQRTRRRTQTRIPLPRSHHRLLNTKLKRALRKLTRPVRRVLTPARTRPLTALEKPTLVLIAHPDDEVFCSGLICHLLSKNIPTHLLCFTRGEGGEHGPLPESEPLGPARETEMKAAAQALGVTSLRFLDYADPPIQNGQLSAPEHDPYELASEISRHLEQTETHQLLTHGSSGEYWHPAHLTLHRLARKLARSKTSLHLTTFNAWNPQHPLPGILNQDDPAHTLLDASPHHDKRLASLSKHTSQAGVFERFANGTLSDFIEQTAHETYRSWS
ncbi:MAG: PIG-L deacetylase family protein [Verrucomicrobiota bacterium]